jgi:hypothetical protein
MSSIVHGYRVIFNFNENKKNRRSKAEVKAAPVPPGETPRLYGRRDACHYKKNGGLEESAVL